MPLYINTTHVSDDDLAETLVVRVVIQQRLDVVSEAAVDGVDVRDPVEDGLDLLLGQDGSSGLLLLQGSLNTWSTIIIIIVNSEY